MKYRLIDLAAVNKHHVPGTAYHWKHGYIPLDTVTAQMWHKKAATKEHVRLEPGWVKHTTSAKHSPAMHEGDYMTLGGEHRHPGHEHSAIPLGGEAKFKPKMKFSPKKPLVAPKIPAAPAKPVDLPKTLSEPGTKVHVQGQGPAHIVGPAGAGKMHVKLASGKEVSVGSHTIKKYDPSLDYSHLKTFAGTAADHHGENDKHLVTASNGEIVPKITQAGKATGYHGASTPLPENAKLGSMGAVKSYTGSGYRNINGQLRQGGDGGSHGVALRKEMAKSHLPEGLKLYRGHGHKTTISNIVAAGPGGTTQDHGFSSTSRSYGSAFGGGMRMHITTSKGLRGLGVENVSAVGKGEREVLLDAHTTYVTHHIEKAPNGQLIAHVTAHNSEDAAGIKRSQVKAIADAKKAESAAALGQMKGMTPKKATVGPSNADKIKNAATMYGTGSKQHIAAQAKFGPKPVKTKNTDATPKVKGALGPIQQKQYDSLSPEGKAKYDQYKNDGVTHKMSYASAYAQTKVAIKKK